MSQHPVDRAALPGYLGISAATDDVVDSDDLYEALLDPHGSSPTRGSGGNGMGAMIMPPVMGVGGASQAGGGGGGFSPAVPAASVPIVPAGLAGAGGGGRGATPPSGLGGGGVGVAGPAVGLEDGVDVPGAGYDLYAGPVLSAGPGPSGGPRPGDAGPGAPASDDGRVEPADSGGGDVPGPAAPLANVPDGPAVPPPTVVTPESGRSEGAIAAQGRGWEEIATAWPAVAASLEKLSGEGGDAFGLVHEIEHGFNLAHVWLLERAHEAASEAAAMVETLDVARKRWEKTEQELAEKATGIPVKDAP